MVPLCISTVTKVLTWQVNWWHLYATYLELNRLGPSPGQWPSAYRTAIHETTGFTPFHITFGRSAVLPIEAFLNFTQQRCSPATTVPSFVNEVHQSLHKAYSSARSHISSAHRQNKDYYDQQKPFVPFQVGDQVWLFTPVVRCGKTKKFTSQWRGPYTVLDRVSKVNYRIKLVGSAAQPKVVHHNRLKLCYGTPQQIVAPNQQLPSNTETRPLYSDIVQRPVHSAAGGYTTSSDRLWIPVTIQLYLSLHQALHLVLLLPLL